MSKKYFYRYRGSRKAAKETKKGGGGVGKEVERRGVKRQRKGRKGNMENDDKCAVARVGKTIK